MSEPIPGGLETAALAPLSAAIPGLPARIVATAQDLTATLPEEIAGFAPETLALALAIVAFGGLVKGLVGFGYAIASTVILATILPPSQAVVVMILPTLVANLALVRELDRAGLASCVRRFWPFVAAAVVGTLAGMALLGRVPKRELAAGLGAFTLAYVAFKQDRVALPGEQWAREVCFTGSLASKVGLGLASGFVFGASNVAVQVVAYLDSLDLDRSTFVGVLAMILVGVSTVRIGAAAVLGLYDAGGLLAVSVVASVPGVLGVKAGERLRDRLPEATLGTAVVVLLAVIGVRLLLKGLVGI